MGGILAVSSVTRSLCVVLLVLGSAGPAAAGDRAGPLLLVQANTARQDFDELEGLKAFGEPRADPSTPQPTGDSGEAREKVDEDGESGVDTAPILQRLTRNPSPGDGFDELDGLKSFGQNWQDLTGSVARPLEGGQEPVSGEEEAAAVGAGQPAAAPEAAELSESQAPEIQAPEIQAPAAAALEPTGSPEGPAGAEEGDPKVGVGDPTAVREGIVVQKLPTLPEEAGQPDPAAGQSEVERAEVARQSQPPPALLEQEIERLFDPQPLEDQGLVLGALPEPGRGSDGAADPPPSKSSVPKEEQAQILSQLEELNPVVATVGEEKIYWTDVSNIAKRLPERYQGRLETVFPILLQRIVDLKLLATAGRRLGLDQGDDLRARVAAYEERLVSQAYLHRHLDNEVTPEALRNRYDEIVQERAARTRIRARHILLKTEADARQVIEELDQGVDFAELAKTRSIGASAANGGSLGRFSVDRMVPAFSAAALALSPGQYTRDPVLTQFGWHVILLEEGADQRSPDYGGLEPDVREDVSQRAIERLLRDLRASAQIEFFPDPDLAAAGAAAAPVEDEAAASEEAAAPEEAATPEEATTLEEATTPE